MGVKPGVLKPGVPKLLTVALAMAPPRTSRRADFETALRA